jgi:CubicO group peptidase (beta-lactamase class C family)
VSPPPPLLASELSAYQRIRRVPGIVAALTRGLESESWGFGTVALGASRVPDALTVFEIGSIGKVFTALLLARLAEDGVLSLDQPIRPLLAPHLKLKDWQGREVTLLHLATHTATLPRASRRMLDHARRNPTNPYRDYTLDDLHADLEEFVPGKEVGRKFEYSNFGYGVLGHLLWRIANESYEALLLGRVCHPLGMNDTVITLSEQQRSRLAQGVFFGRPASLWDMPVLAGAGGLRSTAADMLQLVQIAMGARRSVLDAALAATLEPRVRASDTLSIGLAWHRTAAGTGDVVWHRGETGGMRGFIGFVRERALGLVLLANASAGLDELGVEMLQRV